MAKFQKGQSGNPGGRPKVVAEVRELARSYTEQAIASLAKIATAGRSEAARVSAASALLDRGWGKAAQHVDLGGSVEIRSKEQRDAAVAAALRADG